MEQEKLKSVVESILFISGEPIKISRIAKVANSSEKEIDKILSILKEEYEKGRGITIIKKEDSVQMATSQENSDVVSELVKSEIQEGLSRAALEVLSIVAYRGPITRVSIEAIRGVNCSFTVRALLMRGLLERVDNPEDSRSYLYKVSFEFLKKLGVKSIDELPDFKTLSVDTRIDSVIG